MYADPRVVRDWIALQYAEEGSEEYDRLLAVFDVVWDLTREEPDYAWAFILAVLGIDSSRTIQENLSAGPLEDLLVYHGAAVIERVEAEARANPKFASLLGGVWNRDMSDEVWARVQAVWDRRGWDGIPAA